MLLHTPLPEFRLNARHQSLCVEPQYHKVLDVKSFPVPHHEVVTTGERDVRRCPVNAVPFLFGVFEDSLHVRHLYQVVTCRFPVPVSLKVTHSLLLVLLCEVRYIRRVGGNQLDVFRNVSPYERSRFYEHVIFGISERFITILVFVPQPVDKA